MEVRLEAGGLTPETEFLLHCIIPLKMCVSVCMCLFDGILYIYFKYYPSILILEFYFSNLEDASVLH